MKLSEIAERIDKSHNNEVMVNTDELGKELGIYDMDWVNQDRVKSYWIGMWLCTDSWVGYKMYFFDDKPVAFGYKPYRSANETIKWFNKDYIIEVREYLLSLINYEENFNVELIDFEKEIGDYFTVTFAGNLLSVQNTNYKGEKVRVLKNPNDVTSNKIDIELANGEIKKIDISELQIHYNVI